jgi:hypothetical protein
VKVSCEQLERRLAQLENQVATLTSNRPVGLRGIRKRNSWSICWHHCRNRRELAIGGGAAGYYYACGGNAFSEHVIDAIRRDPEAQAVDARDRLTSLRASEPCRTSTGTPKGPSGLVGRAGTADDFLQHRLVATVLASREQGGSQESGERLPAGVELFHCSILFVRL